MGDLGMCQTLKTQTMTVSLSVKAEVYNPHPQKVGRQCSVDSLSKKQPGDPHLLEG